MKSSSVTRILWTAALVVAGCYLGATIGNLLQFPQIGAAILFPSYAVLTAALLLSPPRRWWPYLLAASVGNVLGHVNGGAAISFALSTEVANQARALVAAYGIRRFGDIRGRVDTSRGMAVFLLFAALLGPAVGALIGAGMVIVRGGDLHYWLAFRSWLLSNTLTGLTLLPIILISVASARARPARIPFRRLLEASALAFALLVVSSLALLQPSTRLGALPVSLYAPLPLLLWAAVRFGPRGASACVLVVAVLAIGGILEGRGPFVTLSPLGDIIHLQLFLFMVSVPLLLLSVLIREQRVTVDELRASRQQYRAVVEDQTDLVCRFRPDGTLTFANGACCRASRRSLQELMGKSFWSLMPAERRDAEKERLAGLSPDVPVATWEHELTTGGERRWEQWRVRAIFDGERRIVDYQAVGRDITERKAAEEGHRLLAAQRMLAEALRDADRRKDEFLAILAHELRNPLAPITMVLEILRQKQSHNDQVRWAREVIGRQVTQLTRLVDDLLDVSRITSGKIQLQMEQLDLAQVIQTAVETSRPLVVARQLELRTDITRGPLPVQGDAARLAQLISNLLNNAAKFTNVGGRIALSVVRDEGQIVLRCADTGVGIPAQMLDRVFEPFTQVDRSRDGKLGGLGLGLTLVKRLVEMHGGMVIAHSDGPGLGSEFVVRLPAIAKSASDRPAAERLDSASMLVGQRRAPARHVLVVDDAEDAAESLARLLILQGHEVHIAHDGLAALDKALRLGPEIVFLDLGLPKMDGLEVARRLRNRFESARMVLVATTGFGQSEDRRRTSEAGFDHHLIKPIDPSAVEAVLSACATG